MGFLVFSVAWTETVALFHFHIVSSILVALKRTSIADLAPLSNMFYVHSPSSMSINSSVASEAQLRQVESGSGYVSI